MGEKINDVHQTCLRLSLSYFVCNKVKRGCPQESEEEIATVR